MHKKVKIKAGEIARIIGAEIRGDKDFIVEDISTPETAEETHIVYLSSKKYLDAVQKSKAKVVLSSPDFVLDGKVQLIADDTELAFVKLLKIFEYKVEDTLQPCETKKYIHPEATVNSSSIIGEPVYISKNVKIGKNCKIFPFVFIGESTVIGDNCVIYPMVSIYAGSIIGNNVIIHSGAVIGSDGFGYIKRGNEYIKIPQIGNVVIEDNVEIGSNTTIDRATIGSTIIRKGCKIDNLVQIAHNVEIGENTVIAGQSGVSGSVKIGKECILAGQVGIADHAVIDDGIIIGAKTGVTTRHVKKEERVVFGIPAKPLIKMKRIEACLNQLPDLLKEFYQLKKEIQQLKQEGEVK